MYLLHESVRMKRFEEPGRHIFFGYFDVCPFGHDGERLLAMRLADTPQTSPGAADLEVGYFRMDEPARFIPVGTTKSWCWQQGCRLQWLPLSGLGGNDLVLYNMFENGRDGSGVHNIATRKIEAAFDAPAYAMTPDGSLAFSVDFDRLQRLRPGYGYANREDGSRDAALPEDSGIWSMRPATGARTLLFSLADIAHIEPDGGMDGAQHYFNHLCVNPDGSRLVFFHLWAKDGKQHSRMMTCGLDGADVHLFRTTEIVSHYWWRTPKEILCYSGTREFGLTYAMFEDFVREPAREFAPGFFSSDGHCSFSPDGRWMMTDTYPDRHGYQNLNLFNGKRRIDVFRQYCPILGPVDARCDLHPRWSPDGKSVAIDSMAEGSRKMLVLDVSQIVTTQGSSLG